MPGRVVKTRIFAVAFTVPPATDPDTPATTDVNVGLVTWDDVRIIIPAGHQFLTGVRLSYAEAAIVPFNDPPDWITGNDDDQTTPVDLDVTAPIVIAGYNVDIYPHTFHLRIKVTDWPALIAATGGPLSASAIESAQ